MPDPSVAARLTLLNSLFKETLTGVAGALRSRGAPPLQASEKEILFAEVEKAVWALPDAWFEEAPRDELAWAEEIGTRPEVRERIDRAILTALAGRARGGARSSLA